MNFDTGDLYENLSRKSRS